MGQNTDTINQGIFKIRPYRVALQIAVIAVLLMVPYMTQNPLDWSPTRAAQKALPDPKVFPVSGDTWAFSVGGFTLLHPTAFVEGALSIKAFYVPMMTAVLIPMIITVALGRVFCSWICPAGFFLELNQGVNRKLRSMGIGINVGMKDLRYPILTIILIASFLIAVPIISIIDPPHVIGREFMYLFTHQKLSMSGIGIIAGIFAFESLAVSRAWCGSLCPSGGMLSILGAKRLLRINMNAQKCVRCGQCDAACPYVLNPMTLAGGDAKADGFDWNKCDNCGLCRDSCPTAAIRYGIGKTKDKAA